MAVAGHSDDPSPPGPRLFGLIGTVAGVLVLPLVVLLFAQWPLRDVLQLYSRQANDLGQIIFALYVAVAVTAASRAGAHLSSSLQTDAPTQAATWRLWAIALCTVPWAVFMLWAAWPVVVQSVLSFEHFGETQSPGYFLIKLAMVLMVVLALLDALANLIPRKARGLKP